MEEKEKTIHQLKKDVLLAYLSRKTPGLSIQGKKHWDEKYEQARCELEKAIERADNEKTG